MIETDLDDETDPSGGLRKAKRHLLEARAAHLADSAGAFNEAADALLATVRRAGPRLGQYPRQGVIDLEVAYNRFAPFRLAWWLTSAAFVCVALSMATRATSHSAATEAM